jgi:protein gp37
MADKSAIEWTDATWNPVTGCDRVSPGCAHCYALTLAGRLKGMGNPHYQRDGDPKSSGPGFGVTLHEDVLDKPLRWRKPRMVFVNSMSDLFHDAVPDEFIRRVFHRMAETPQHTYQVLTKRPERMCNLLRRWASPVDPADCCESCVVCWHDYSADFPLPNVWLGVSIENRRFVHRADLLRETPAAVRFISAEPLLGSLVNNCAICLGHGSPCSYCDGKPGLRLDGIDWLIVGGESGLGHRRVDPQWVRDLRDACHVDDREGCYCAGPDAHTDHCHGQCQTAFFFKQWGGHTPKAGGRELDGRTWDEFPVLTSQRAA